MNGAASLDGLTAKQCECLELVLLHMTSKQIALELRISHYTVDERLNAARVRLGASTRVEAALIYEKLKRTPEALACPPEGLAISPGETASSSPEMLIPESLGVPEMLGHEPFGMAIPREKPSPDLVTAKDLQLQFSEPLASGNPLRTGFALSGQTEPGLGKGPIVSRIFIILGLAAAMMMTVLVAVAAGDAMTRIFHARSTQAPSQQGKQYDHDSFLRDSPLGARSAPS